MLSFFPRYVLDEIWDLIESVSESFPAYSLVILKKLNTETRVYRTKFSIVAVLIIVVLYKRKVLSNYL